MIDSKNLEDLVREVVSKEQAFLVDFRLEPTDRILVEVDKSGGVSLGNLTAISRAIESELDRDEEDFSLEVTSPGVGTPFKVWDQYPANIGRPIKVTLVDGTEHAGDLTKAEDAQITLKWKERVPKEVGKGKKTVEVEKTIGVKDIKQTKLEVRF